jgi:hypothetical protein
VMNYLWNKEQTDCGKALLLVQRFQLLLFDDNEIKFLLFTRCRTRMIVSVAI